MHFTVHLYIHILIVLLLLLLSRSGCTAATLYTYSEDGVIFLELFVVEFYYILSPLTFFLSYVMDALSACACEKNR